MATADCGATSGSFAFDGLGNLVTDAETVSATGATTTTSFSYDAANRLQHTDAVLAEDGSQTTTYYGWDTTNARRTWEGPNATPSPSASPTNEAVVYSYNAAGRLSGYSSSTRSSSASYAYDALGQRTQSSATVGGNTTATDFLYEDTTLMSLSATQGSSTWKIDYLYDEEGTPYAGVYRSPATSASATYFTVVTNDRGDVVELLDANGNAIAAYRYDAWGLPLGSGSYSTGIWAQSTGQISSALAGQIASRQVLRYAGYAYDAESGLYYCAARYYDPVTRQWISGDPAKADGEESAYQYCSGNPVGNSDPTGQYTYCASKAAKYAEKWCRMKDASGKWVDGRNTDKYQYLEGHDCTNYTSQCLKAGGWTEKGSFDTTSKDNWFSNKPGGKWWISRTWLNADYWWSFAKRQGRGSGVRPEKCPRGGIMQFRLDGVMAHSGFCIANNHGNPIYRQHSGGDNHRTLKKLRDLLHHDPYKDHKPRVFAWYIM